jgi:N-acetylglucosamine kinase-like BadF-type ATPase
MMLIVDSGSMKTDWGVVQHGQLVQQVSTKGMNPYFLSEEELESEFVEVALPQLGFNSFDAVYFYGSGCTPQKVPIVSNILMNHIKVTKTLEVATDMLAAARALCGRKSGIACIMGTGSNSCYYDGGKIADHIPPLGYILGDEGSGAVLGKLLVGEILKNQWTPALKEKFLKQYELTPADIIERVYCQPFPNRFLASLSPFLAQNIREPMVHALVVNSFKDFLKRNVMRYDYRSNKVHFVGSIACYYKETLMQAVAEMGMKAGRIVKSPMEGLLEFHTAC